VDLIDLVVHLATLRDLVFDLLHGVHDGGVVLAAKVLADLGQRQVRELATQVHCDLPGRDKHPRPGGAGQLLHGDAEVLRGLADDAGCSDLRVVVADEVLQHHLREREVDLLLVQGSEGGDADERTLKFADVAGDV